MYIHIFFPRPGCIIDDAPNTVCLVAVTFLFRTVRSILQLNCVVHGSKLWTVIDVRWFFRSFFSFYYFFPLSPSLHALA